MALAAISLVPKDWYDAEDSASPECLETSVARGRKAQALCARQAHSVVVVSVLLMERVVLNLAEKAR